MGDIIIQRLLKPTATTDDTFSRNAHVFSFGSIPPEIQRRIADVALFDVMEDPELDWGAVPASLETLMESELVTEKYSVLDNPEIVVYIICVERSLINAEALADTLWTSNRHTKEGSAGWLEVTKHIMLFQDASMYNNFCQFFDIEPED